ncbi:SGNH/GDSL hydrolase family protein [Alloyangia pacifica]|uniref:Phospholipase/lecithinase/hemolysin n=1 Tax=Alloyangia pacifica TaxID=311180 RepID=A0A1I6W833_9RHOB|nr:SGNH/GDSL hydrolase family protein [Alloyangia pacifica]SDI43189.1 Phospholipase/lecithinase/hemolysin [Alloyangia pacifica]SFT22100.1 Phospholipase/lecithinase/hemolysin [Alloyangia pacifica]
MPTSGSQIIYFGDSLTDVGVVFEALVQSLVAQILPGLIAALGPDPSPEEIAQAELQARQLATQQALVETQALGFGPEQAVTNEFTHAIYTGDVSGDTILNFANAGARALGTQEPFGPGTGYDSNLGAQLARFAALPAGTLAPDASAVLFIGANDFSDAVGEALDQPGSGALDVIVATGEVIGELLDMLEAAARGLHSAGVTTVYFGTLPVGSFFPGSDALDDLTSDLSDLAVGLYNELLAARAVQLRGEGIAVEVIDYAAVASAITEDPGGFGIVADRSEFLIDGAPFDSDQVGFWDPIHPAEAVHQAWGAYAAFVMAGGSTSALSDFGTLNFQTSGDNAVFAMGGNDTVLALAGDDVVFGGSGDDRVFAGPGDDIVSGGSGDDLLRGERGADILDGGSGDDTVLGGSGDDVLIDGLGDDLVRGGAGDDVFIFVQNTLEGEASLSQDVLQGGSGTDTLYVVLDETTFDAFETLGATSVLSSLGISISSIESVVAIDGRGQVEAALSAFAWFQDGDYWGLIPAPSSADLLV